MSSHQHQPLTPANASWIWSGVHGASGIIHPFLAEREPHYFDPELQTYLKNTILDGSGGLLLIRRSPYPRHVYDVEEIAEALWRMNINIFDVDEDDDSDNTPSEDEDDDSDYTPADEDDDSDYTPADEDDDSDNTTEFDDSDEDRIDRIHRMARLYLGVDLDSTDEQASLEPYQCWQTLVVVNPSTHESRVLPPANSRDVGLEFWSYNGVLANLLVDTESQTYRVTLTFPDCVCLYSSTSNAWQCRKFNQRISWGPHSTVLLATPWRMEIANATVNGRLFFADVVVEDSIPTMNLIEIDVEVGSWKLHNWHYSLQTQFREFLNTPFLRMRGLTERGMHRAGVLNNRNVPYRDSSRAVENFEIVSYGDRGRAVENFEIVSYRDRSRAVENFEIVECMGELYAVIPMSLEESLPMSLRSRRTLTEVVHEYANFDLCFMPMQFLIVRMHGDGFVHGVLRILLPEDGDRCPYLNKEYREYVLMNMVTSGAWEPDRDGDNWRFSCTAEGSVIWVALLGYVLQYDVLTGVSKTEIVGAVDSLETVTGALCDGQYSLQAE